MHDEGSPAPAPVHLVASNLTSAASLFPANGTMELAFDRLLSPLSISRQTFVLHDADGWELTPIVTYDPVARIVSLTPLGWLDAHHVYEVDVLAPTGPQDVNGLRSVDGATLAQAPLRLAFSVGGADTTAEPSPPTVDFCLDILPVFANKCAASTCHAGPLSADGLRLDSPQGVTLTALGQVALGANTGPTSAAQPPSLIFGLNMPVIDPGPGSPSAGIPGDSWLLYKLLLGAPTATSSTPLASDCDGGTVAPPDTSGAHIVPWGALPPSEIAALSSVVLGQAMPPPSASPDGAPNAGLSLDEMERISVWIASGAVVPSACGCQTP